jgi:hypothetical protein
MPRTRRCTEEKSLRALVQQLPKSGYARRARDKPASRRHDSGGLCPPRDVAESGRCHERTHEETAERWAETSADPRDPSHGGECGDHPQYRRPEVGCGGHNCTRRKVAKGHPHATDPVINYAKTSKNLRKKV